MSFQTPDQENNWSAAREVRELREQSMDRHVATRIRKRRINLGLSQMQLARLIGVTCQQAYKYELALNRISAGRLYLLAQAFNTPIEWFFEGTGDDDSRSQSSPRTRLSLELHRHFALISDDAHCEALCSFARALARPPTATAKQSRNLSQDG